MNITVVGTGYVGLVTGACFAEMGNKVVCVDIDSKKIENLKIGVLPIYEPGLDDVVARNYAADRLTFTTDIASAMAQSDIYFIAVGTPPGEDGSADLKYVVNVAKQIGANLDKYAVVVNKSTVPVGTADLVESVILDELKKRGLNIEFDVVSNPEFLKEGAAVNDFMSPDRIVVGARTTRSRSIMEELYAPFTRNHPRTIFMGVRDSEMTKYAANAMLATKISFMNEISNMCEILDVDVEKVRLGIGSDDRIGFHFIYPGAGYGGSCFPKDVKALIGMAQKNNFDAKLLQAVEERNNIQKGKLLEKVNYLLGGNLKDATIAVWGLSFKPGTDDMREAPSKVLIDSLLEAGAHVKAYDPIAMETARAEFDQSFFDNGRLLFVDSQYDAAEFADALVLVTEWKSFRHPDFNKLSQCMKAKNIVDGRNQYQPDMVRKAGFKYIGIGRT